MSNNDQSNGGGSITNGNEQASADSGMFPTSSPDADDTAVGSIDDDVELSARTKIQAISRGMLARKNFGRIKQETLAMIVIQRTLLRSRRNIRGNK
jgi:hypothetical protein